MYGKKAWSRFPALCLTVIAGTGLLSSPVPAQEKSAPKGPPPALVTVAPITKGSAEPKAELVGTVFYARTSRVAAEVEGLVEKISFEEGIRVKAGDPLVELRTDLLDALIDGARGSYEQAQVDMERAEKDLRRIDSLYKEESVAEAVYDEYFFKEKNLRKKLVFLKAALDRLLLQRKKKTIFAPFDGIVLEKLSEKGEWVSEGGTVARIADESLVDVVVDIPGSMLKYLKEGRTVKITVDQRPLTGTFVSFIPKGDISTRTFAAKFRLENTAGLAEGMEARAVLPSARRQAGLLVHRDGVIEKQGRSVVFVVEEGKARMVHVTVTGYDGMQVGIAGDRLEAGLTVVTKGNERLRDGQPVTVSDR